MTDWIVFKSARITLSIKLTIIWFNFKFKLNKKLNKEISEFSYRDKFDILKFFYYCKKIYTIPPTT
jgi:hypothetical protein